VIHGFLPHGTVIFEAMNLHRRLLTAACVFAIAASAACERKSTSATQSTTGDILVGFYGSLTGDGASFGISSREGAQMAVDDINSAGGLLGGRKIKLLVEDDQSKPEEASNAVTKLITQDKVVGVIGEVASRRSLAAGPVCQKYQTPMVSPASTNERVTEIGDYIFRVCFIDPFQGEVLAKFAFNDLKAKKGSRPERHRAGLLRGADRRHRTDVYPARRPGAGSREL
jgi:branched-chain amino acid transport system substrate-binding protein